ncbi:MAG: ABC transporter substrate-binding protein [Deltaproteobacteria bacterium]|nr:ABC transporter substrate-binding protein [Deltaproteobacteria bacterium]
MTDTEIVIGMWAPMTGPASAYSVIAKGLEAYFAKINEEGGIHGRQIKLLVRDDGYQPAKTVTVVKELVEKDGVFAFVAGLGTATGMAVKDYLDEQKKPFIGPATGSSVWGHPASKYRFAVYPTYETEARLITEYAVNNLKKTKFAVFYQNDAFGKEGLDSVKATAARLSAEVAAEVPHELTDTDLSSQALKIKASGADTVILWSTPKFTATFVKECHKLGYKPQFLTTSTVTDPVMFALAGDAWNGTISANWMPLADSDEPDVVWYREAINKYDENLKPGNFTLVPFVLTEPFVEALRRVGPELTTDALFKALESFEHFNGKFVHDVTYGPDDRQGVESIYLVQAREGKFVKITEWLQ